MSIFLILLAAGDGKRLKSKDPKPFILVNNKTIIEHLQDKEFFCFHSSSFLSTGNNLFYIGRRVYDARLAFINNEIEQLNENNIFYFHNEIRLSERILEKHKSSPNFHDYSFKGMKEESEIKNRVKEIFNNLKQDDLIILDIGLKYFREVFLFLEENGFTNRVINNFGTLENRFKKISFDLIQLSTNLPIRIGHSRDTRNCSI